MNTSLWPPLETSCFKGSWKQIPCFESAAHKHYLGFQGLRLDLQSLDCFGKSSSFLAVQGV